MLPVAGHTFTSDFRVLLEEMSICVSEWKNVTWVHRHHRIHQGLRQRAKEGWIYQVLVWNQDTHLLTNNVMYSSAPLPRALRTATLIG